MQGHLANGECGTRRGKAGFAITLHVLFGNRRISSMPTSRAPAQRDVLDPKRRPPLDCPKVVFDNLVRAH